MIDIKHIYIYFLTFSPTKYIKIIIYQLPSLFYRCISRQNALCCLGWLSLVLLILLGELKDEKLLRIDLDLLSLGPFILCFWIYLQLGVTFQFLIRIWFDIWYFLWKNRLLKHRKRQNIDIARARKHHNIEFLNFT